MQTDIKKILPLKAIIRMMSYSYLKVSISDKALDNQSL